MLTTYIKKIIISPRHELYISKDATAKQTVADLWTSGDRYLLEKRTEEIMTYYEKAPSTACSDFRYVGTYQSR